MMRVVPERPLTNPIRPIRLGAQQPLAVEVKPDGTVVKWYWGALE